MFFVISCITAAIINCLTFEMQRVPGPGSPVPCISFEYNCEVKEERGADLVIMFNVAIWYKEGEEDGGAGAVC